MNALYYQTLLSNERIKTADLERQLAALRQKQETNFVDIHEREVQALENQISILTEDLKDLQSTIDIRDKSLVTVREQRDSELLATNELMAQAEAHSALMASIRSNLVNAINQLNGIRSGENVTPNDIWQALEYLDSANSKLLPKN